MKRIIGVSSLYDYLSGLDSEEIFGCSNLRVLSEDIVYIFKGKKEYKKGTFVCLSLLERMAQDVGCGFKSLGLNGNLTAVCYGDRILDLRGVGFSERS